MLSEQSPLVSPNNIEGIGFGSTSIESDCVLSLPLASVTRILLFHLALQQRS